MVLHRPVELAPFIRTYREFGTGSRSFSTVSPLSIAAMISLKDICEVCHGNDS